MFACLRENYDASRATLHTYLAHDDFFGKPSTYTEDHTTDPRHDFPSGSGATSTDVRSLCSSDCDNLASGTKEEAEEIQPVSGVQPNSVQNQRRSSQIQFN